MPNEPELPSDSDEDDEDYVPEGEEGEALSTVESEGDDESNPEEENNENRVVSNKGKGKTRGKVHKKKRGKQRKKTVLKEDEEEKPDEESNVEKPQLTEEEEKKKADSLWADFMKDTGTVSKSQPVKSPNNSQSNVTITRPKVEEKVKITKVFEFAGEEVKVEKEVPIDSAEARLSLPNIEKTEKTSGSSARGQGVKRAGLGGISSVLGQLGKKSKISTLEKSKLDWDSFKKEENIDEEINTHNRGKDGYLERQDFLQRADVRRFEIEKQMRLSRRSSR